MPPHSPEAGEGKEKHSVMNKGKNNKTEVLSSKSVFDDMSKDGLAIGMVRKTQGTGRDLFIYIVEEDYKSLTKEKAQELAGRVFSLIKEWEENRDKTKSKMR